jgi:cation:H+ antiporter
LYRAAKTGACVLFLLIIIGFVLLLVGGEFLVRGASGLAAQLGVSPLVIGIVIVGFGTSTPELVTSVQAALSGAPGLAIGNIIGSNIANILLILGAGALIYPMACSRDVIRRDGALVIGTAFMLGVAAYAGGLTRIAGMVFVVALVLYMWLLMARERRAGLQAVALAGETVPVFNAKCPKLWSGIGFTLAGTLGVILGGKMLVEGAVALAEAWGISEEIIGLTVVALGTSLPELATSVIAALKRNSEIALGNVLGSNVYNILGIGGVTATISPLSISPQLLMLDIPLMIGLSVLMIAIAAMWNGIGRWAGALFLGGYGTYVATLLG